MAYVHISSASMLTALQRASRLQRGWVDWHLGCRRASFGIAQSGERVTLQARVAGT